MTTSNQNSIPVGIYVLSVLMIVPALEVLYSAINTEINIYFAAISVPIFTYVGIGIISRWPRARDLYIVVAVLLFLGAIPDLLMGLSSQEATAIHNAENIVQFTILPIAYFYLKRENVNSYFESAS